MRERFLLSFSLLVQTQSSSHNFTIMFLICLLLIALVTIAMVNNTEPSTVAEQAEFVPVRVSLTKNQKS